jgi:hypothetical protein
MGGYNPPPTLQMTNTETWNGSSWTEVNELNTRRTNASSAQQSPSTSTLTYGGYTTPPPNTAATEAWNGTSWTAVADLNAAKDNGGGTGTSSSSAMNMGGRGPLTATEYYDGTSWTEVADLAKGRGYVASAGNGASNAMISGGESPDPSPPNYYDNQTEEWSAADQEIKTVTTS